MLGVRRAVGTGLAGLVCLVVFAGGLGGCRSGAERQGTATGSEAPSTGSRPSASGAPPTARPTTAPAAAAGGVCKVFDYAEVKATLGTDFHVAAAGQSGGARSCALKTLDAGYPDLTFSMVPITTDAATFRTAVAPKGSLALTGLGQAAYSVILNPAGTAGAAVEVGWLRSGGRLLTLRYTYPPPGGGGEAPGLLVPKLVTLAKAVDKKAPS